MKEETFTKIKCNETCTDAPFSEDAEGFNVNGIQTKFEKGRPVVQSVDDEHLYVVIFSTRTMIHHGLQLICKDGSVYHPLIDRRGSHKENSRTEDLLCLESQIKHKSRNYICRLCGSKSKSYMSPKPESVRKHINKFHEKTAQYDVSHMDSLLAVITAFVVENGSSLDFAVNKPFTSAVLQQFNVAPSKLSKSKLRDILINLAIAERRFLKQFVCDPFFEIPTLSSNDEQFYSEILQQTARCHTFYSLTQDGLKKRNIHYQSIFLHLTGIYTAMHDRHEIKRDHSAHLLSLTSIENTSSNNLYQHTRSILNERVGNLHSLAAITTDGAPNVTGMRNLFSNKHKVFSLRCTAHSIQLFYADLFVLMTASNDIRPVHKFDSFFSAVSELGMTDSEYDELMKYASFEDIKSIRTARQLKTFLKDVRHTYLARMTCMEDILVPTSDSVSKPTEESETRDLVDKEETPFRNQHDTNTSFVGVELDNDEVFIPDLKIDFNATETYDQLIPLSSDSYYLSVYERAKKIDNLERIIEGLDECNFDTNHQNFIKAQVYLKSVGYTLENIQHLNKKLRALVASLDQNSELILNLNGRPVRYIEVRWMSLKAFYKPFVGECRPVNFLNWFKERGFKSLSLWLTYEDFIFMRIMMGYLNELEHITKVVSHDDFCPITIRPVLDVAYECSSTMLYNFEKLEFISKETYIRLQKKNHRRNTKNSRGTLQDLMYLLNTKIISTENYLTDTSILVHNIVTYKFTNELFMDKDHYLTSHKNSSVDKLPEHARKYANVKNLRMTGQLNFEPTRNTDVLECFSENKTNDSYGNHCLFHGTKHKKIVKPATKYKKLRNLKEIKDGNILYKNKGYSPTGQLLNLIAKDVSLYARMASFVHTKYFRFMAAYQKKHQRENDETHNRIYLHLTKLDMLNNLAASTYLKQGYQSPFTWVLNLVMSVKGTSVINERGFSHVRYVDNTYRNNMDGDLLEAMVQLNIKSKTFEESHHFEALAKGLSIKKERDVAYNFGSLKSTRNDYNLNVDNASDDDTNQTERTTAYRKRRSVEKDDFYSESDSTDFDNNGSE